MTISASTHLRVVVLLTSIALTLVLLLAGAVAAMAADDPVVNGPVVTAEVRHTVMAGDTLWDIAASFSDPGMDVRETIHDIKQLNGLSDSVLQVGQVLLIPVEF